MTPRRWFWMLAAVIGLTVSLRAASQSVAWLKPLIAARFPRVQWVNAATLTEWEGREPAKRPTILDVRTEAEFAVSHLRRALRVNPDGANLASLGIAPDTTVVVYCSVGYRSAAIVGRLERAGISKVYNLEGGIFEWANEGRPLYGNGTRANLVHPYDTLWGRFLRTDLHAPAVSE